MSKHNTCVCTCAFKAICEEEKVPLAQREGTWGGKVRVGDLVVVYAFLRVRARTTTIISTRSGQNDTRANQNWQQN